MRQIARMKETEIEMIVFLFGLLFLSTLRSTGGVCPFKCSGHGACIGGFCECRRDYQGAICSERTCPVANAWIAKPFELMEDPVTYTSYALRPQIECSNQGLCDRKTGICRCFPGFTGAACQRTTCGASKCSGHGECVISRYFYEEMFPTSPRNYYNNWESNQTTACLCHNGYFGPDCSYRLCPKGLNPFVPFNRLPTLRLTIYDDTAKSTRPNGPAFIFTFQGKSFYFHHRRWTMADCKRQFESLPNVETVNCTLESTPTSFLKTILVTFEAFPLLPFENNVYVNNGDPNDWKVGCVDTRGPGARGTSCSIEIVNNSMSSVRYPTYEFCSGRGVCDLNAGTCSCFSRSFGAACEQVRYPLKPPVPLVLEDILLLNASKLNFNGSDLFLSTMYLSDDSFNALLLSEGSKNLTKVTGFGSLVMNYGSLTIKGLNGTAFSGQTIYAGGLNVTAGLSVVTGGLQVSNGDLTIRGNASLGEGLISRRTLEITGPLVSPGGLTVLSNGMNVDSGGIVTRAGGMTIAAGGVILNDGLSVAAGGIMVLRRGITISDSGLVINSGGLSMRGPFNCLTVPPNGGITIGSGGIAVTGGLTVQDVGLVVSRGGLTIAEGGFLVTSGITVHSGGLELPSGLTVNDEGLSLPSGLTLSDSLFLSDQGFSVTDGGLSVASAGVYATAGLTLLGATGMSTPSGLTVNDVGLHIETVGATIASGGLLVTGGVTVSNGLVSRATGSNQRVLTAGVHVGAGGGTVRAGGLSLTGGLSIHDIGAVVVSGVSLNDEHLFISRGLSVGSGGVRVGKGLTVEFGGAAVADGVRVRDGGVALTGSLSVTGGLIVTGALTLSDSGLYITTGGLTVSSLGLISEEAMSVRNIGVVVRTGGLSVLNTGLLLSGGSVSVGFGGASLGSSSAVSVLRGLVVVSGGLSLRSGDLAVTSGAVSIASSGLVLTGGLSVDSTGLLITSGGLTVTGNLISSSALTVRDRGILVASGGVTIEGSGLQISQGGLAVSSRGVAAPAMTVHTMGVLVTGGLTVLSPLGNNIVQGGITLNNGGISTDLGRLQGSGVLVSSGVTVFTAGAIVTGGASIASGGLRAPSATVASGGLAATSGLTVYSGGVRTPALTVRDIGLVVTNGLTVAFGGVSSPYLTIRRGGLFVDQLQVMDAAAGLVVSSGLTVAGEGVVVSGGLTVPWLAVTDGVTVSTHGVMVKIGDPIYVNDMGMIVADGQDLTVYGGTRLSSDYTYTSPSDTRLKTKIRAIPDSMQLINNIHGVQYKPYDPLADPEKRYFGVLAQEIQRVLPEAVTSFSLSKSKEPHLVDSRHLATTSTGREGRYLSVDYIALLPVLVNAVVELMDRLELRSSNSTRSPLPSPGCGPGEDPSLFSSLNSLLGGEEGDEVLLRRRIDAISCDCLSSDDGLQTRLEELRDELRSVRRDWLDLLAVSS